ncbi:hypothetical protein MXB_4570 [Myxobolus squamalis]|nr:hypothetical protein MXB_4570 [Myxobolus squamalis]
MIWPDLNPISFSIDFKQITLNVFSAFFLDPSITYMNACSSSRKYSFQTCKS